jgi:hypothetical protein
MFGKVLLFFSFLVLFSMSPIYAWQYGVSMQPVTNQYDSVEMTARSAFLTTYPYSVAIFLWVSSTSEKGLFTQLGYIIGSSNYPICIPPKKGSSYECIKPNEWGFFWAIYVPTEKALYGEIFAKSNGKLPSDYQLSFSYYFTIRLCTLWRPSVDLYTVLAFYITTPYSANKILSYEYMTRYSPAPDGSYYWGRYTGNVGSILESGISSSYGDFYADHITIWAQQTWNNYRNFGSPGIILATYDAPYDARLRLYNANEFRLGFNIYDFHYGAGTILWNNVQGSATAENVPPCP